MLIINYLWTINCCENNLSVSCLLTDMMLHQETCFQYFPEILNRFFIQLHWSSGNFVFLNIFIVAIFPRIGKRVKKRLVISRNRYMFLKENQYNKWFIYCFINILLIYRVSYNAKQIYIISTSKLLNFMYII